MSWTSGALSVDRFNYGRNVITYAGGGVGTLTLTRTTTYADGRVETVDVAGAVAIPATAPGLWIDGDVPFGAKVSGVVYQLGAVTVEVPSEARTTAVLSDPFTGLSTSVIGTEIGDRTWHSSTSASWLEVAVLGNPLVSARPEQAPQQALSVFTTTRADREALAAMCGPRRTLLLRTTIAGVDDMWFTLVGERVESRLIAQDGTDEWRRHSLEAYTVTRPNAARPHAGETLAAVALEVPTTLGDIAARWPTLGAIAAEVLTAERVS